MDIRYNWSPAALSRPPEGDEHGRLIDELRRLQDVATSAHPPDEVLAQAADAVRLAADLLAAHRVEEEDYLTGVRWELSGRGQTLVPVPIIDELTDTTMRGRVTFGAFHLGRGGAAHGGAIPLLWDELLAGLSQRGSVRKRTAFLHVDYRNLTPVEREISFTAQLDRVEGRKSFLSGRLMDGDVLCAEAHGLFITDPSSMA